MKHKKLLIAFFLVLVISIFITYILEGSSSPYKDLNVFVGLLAIFFSGNIYWKTLSNERYVGILWLIAYSLTFVYCVISSFGRHVLGWEIPIHQFFCLSPLPFVVIYFISKLSQTGSQSKKLE